MLVNGAVIDSSVVLAVLFREVTDETIVDQMRHGVVSCVNVLEIHTKLLLAGIPIDKARRIIAQLQCEIEPLDAEQSKIASEMVLLTRPFGLSLGDRACLALGIRKGAVVITADRIWARLGRSGVGLPVEIEVIR